MKKEKYFFLCIDLEKFDLPVEFGTFISEREQYEVSYKGCRRLLSLLKDKKINATFFVTISMAKACPKLIKEIQKDGNEIALHYDNWDKEKNLEECKKGLENICGREVVGFKSHRFSSFFSDEILNKLDFLYENAVHPTYVPGRYFNIFKKSEIFKRRGIWHIPISVVPFLKLPFSWIWFRNFGINYAKISTFFSFMKNNLVNIYFHSWDFQNFINYNFKSKYFFLPRKSGIICLRMLEEYLNWLKEKNIIFSTFRSYLKEKC